MTTVRRDRSEVVRDGGSLRVTAARCGPPGSGNGGWTAGLLAGHLDPTAPVTVTLRRPPPLDTDLRVSPVEDGAQLRHGSDLIAEAVPDPEAALEPVDPVDASLAASAEESYAGWLGHPFPTCFVCGPDRAPGDGLRLAPGPTTAGRTACTWVPHAAFAEDDATVAEPYVWAALDCPGGWTTDLEGRPMVLGRITARVDRRPVAGERLVVVGQHTGTRERKTWTRTTVYDGAGEVVGRAAQLWIGVDAAAFASRQPDA